MKFRILIIAAMILLAACGRNSDNTENIKSDVGEFAKYLFNYDFHNAMKFCTPESRKWILYMASNINEDDLRILRSQENGATVEVSDISTNWTDSTGTATVKVNNFMQLDTIGHSGRILREGIFKFSFVHSGNRWTVRMEGLPRSEKSGRD